jgi:hypothetical protein
VNTMRRFLRPKMGFNRRIFQPPWSPNLEGKREMVLHLPSPLPQGSGKTLQLCPGFEQAHLSSPTKERKKQKLPRLSWRSLRRLSGVEASSLIVTLRLSSVNEKNASPMKIGEANEKGSTSVPIKPGSSKRKGSASSMLSERILSS